MELIAAIDRRGGIGKDGRLLYRLPEDMKRFRALTMDKVLLMGRETFLSLPGQRPLPGRRNCVLSRSAGQLRLRFPAKEDGPFFYESVEAVLAAHAPERIMVIGGESVYRQLLPMCSVAHITEIDAVSDADRFLHWPEAGWTCIRREPSASENPRFAFCTYIRDEMPEARVLQNLSAIFAQNI